MSRLAVRAAVTVMPVSTATWQASGPHQLVGIGETVLLCRGDRGQPRAHRMLTETSPVQDKLASIYVLARYAPRR